MRQALQITDMDRARIRAAVKQAEATTSGEIFTVVAVTSDDYRVIPLLWATLAALLLPLPLLFLWWLPDGWTYQGAATGLSAAAVYAAQLVLFIALALALSWPRLRLAVTPRSVREDRAHALAVQQFLAHGLHMTDERTGVLIFVSLGERYAEIVADAAIDRKVDQKVWDDMMATLVAEIRAGRLVDGLAGTVTGVGAVLAGHFPPKPDDANELVDDLVLI